MGLFESRRMCAAQAIAEFLRAFTIEVGLGASLYLSFIFISSHSSIQSFSYISKIFFEEETDEKA